MYYPTAYIKQEFIKFIDKNIKTIFEIGSRDLLDSIKMAEVFQEATIYAYECNPLTLNECNLNLEKNADKKIIFTEKAVSDKIEQLEFHNFMLNNPGASSLFKRFDYENTQSTLYKVQTTTIKDELQKYNLSTIDLLCMDVQGYELKVLMGADLNNNKIKNVILEAPKDKSVYDGAPSRKEIEEYMFDNKYIVKQICQENLIEDNILFSLE